MSARVGVYESVVCTDPIVIVADPYYCHVRGYVMVRVCYGQRGVMRE